MKKLILLLGLVSSSLLYAEKCSVQYRLMYEIAKNEHHPKRAVGYPFLISFNKEAEMSLVPSYMEKHIVKLDKRVIDCANKETCIYIFERLLEKGVKNIDLGAFQINAMYHKEPPAVYFSLKKSYKKACRILEALEKQYGWSWQTIGRYHSATKKYNQAYIKRIQKRMKKT